VLNNNGYNLSHNFGHGKQYLARIVYGDELIGLRLPHRLRLPGNALAASPQGKRRRHQLLPTYTHHLRLHRIPLMAQPHEYIPLLQRPTYLDHPFRIAGCWG
jgi:hypothetical protein